MLGKKLIVKMTETMVTVTPQRRLALLWFCPHELVLSEAAVRKIAKFMDSIRIRGKPQKP
jgi:hypothetical protein